MRRPPVAEDGDAYGGLDLPDRGPIGLAGVALSLRSAMDGDETAAVVLDGPRHFQVVAGVAVPPQANLGGHGDRKRARKRADNAADLGGIAQQPGAGAPSGDAAGGTTHVDIEDVGLALHQSQGGGEQAGLVIVEDLHGHRPLQRFESQRGIGLG